MPSTRKLSADFELTTRENGHDRRHWRARGDIYRIGAPNAVATVFGEGSSLAAAEDEVWLAAQEWVTRRGRAR